MSSPNAFKENSRIFLTTSALLEAGSSSDVLNHFLGFLLKQSRASHSVLIVPETVVKELESMATADSAMIHKTNRIMNALLNCIQAQEIHFAKNPHEEMTASSDGAVRVFLEEQIRSNFERRNIYIVTNDDALAQEIYCMKRLASSNTGAVEVRAVVNNGSVCKLKHVAFTGEPTPTPEPMPGPKPEPNPDSEQTLKPKVKIEPQPTTIEQIEADIAAARIRSTIQLDPRSDQEPLPKISRDEHGNIKVPHN